MGPLNETFLLALDGGNSKTDVLLVAEDGTVITARVRGRSSRTSSERGPPSPRWHLP